MEQLSEKTGFFAMLVTVLSLGASPHPVLLILAYLIHELGHIVFSRIAGAKIKKFRIGALHLSLSYDCSNLTYKREMLVQAGGIIFNVIFAALVYLLPFFNGERSTFFIVCSLSLAIMNLYPVTILDGGGLLKSLLLQISSGDVAEKVTKTVSFICTVLMWLVAVYLQIIFASGFSIFFISVLLLVELCFSMI